MPRPDALGALRRGAQFLTALSEGRAARAVWQALPGERWTDRLAEAAAATLTAGAACWRSCRTSGTSMRCWPAP